MPKSVMGVIKIWKEDENNESARGRVDSESRFQMPARFINLFKMIN